MRSRELGFLHLAAAASAGAALIHAAAAGSHGDHNAVQLVFAVWAVLQLGWAALVLAVPRTPVTAAGIVLNAGAVGCWLVQRTAGLPLIDALAEPEDVGLQDSLAATLGTLAVLFAASSLVPRLARRRLPGALGIAGAVAAILLALPAMAVDHGSDGGHSHGGEQAAPADGHAHGHEAEEAAVAREDRCDLGFNTAEYNETTTLVEEAPEHMGHHDGVDFTVEEWAEEFADESIGVDAPALADWLSADPFSVETVLGGDLTPSLDPDPWVPMTDPAECAALASELQQARDAAARYPTLADALAAGYQQGSLYAPGQGAHYSKFDYIVDDGFHPDQPELLMYDGQEPDSKLMGVMYYLVGSDGLPEDVGFTGDNDRWHAHEGLCRNADGVAVSKRECAEGRATVTDERYGWMLHAWVVPGCESDWGVYSGGNPALPWLPSSELSSRDPTTGSPFPTDIVLAPGCNSGKTVADPLELDRSGDGPTVD